MMAVLELARTKFVWLVDWLNGSLYAIGP